MSWFMPKLEPGERVVLRSPSLLWRWTLPLGWASLPVLIWLGINQFGDKPWPNDTQDWLLLKFYIGLGAISACLYFPQYRWRLMVTDRRLIARKGWLRNKFEIIPLDRIDRLRPSETLSGFDILCGDEVHAVEGGLLEFQQLHKVLDLPDARGMIYETNLRKILALGESVVTRQAPGLWAGWWAVTNRRFLYYDPAGPVEEMNLHDIEDVARQPYVPIVTLRGDGREITIRCFDDEAERIVSALGHEPAEGIA